MGKKYEAEGMSTNVSVFQGRGDEGVNWEHRKRKKQKDLASFKLVNKGECDLQVGWVGGL